MKKKSITGILVLFLICSRTALLAQVVTERVLAITDKSVYLAGEQLWLKLFCFGEGSHPSNSKVAYIEILDSKNQPRVQLKAGLDDGVGKSVLVLPQELPSGSYTLCVYSRWMMNFGENGFFKKRITVINSFKPVDSIRIPSAPAETDFPVKSLAVKISQESSVSGKRQSKLVKVSVPFGMVGAYPSGLSVSVYRIDALQPAEYLPLQYSGSGAINAAAPVSIYPPELKGPIVTGYIRSRKTGNPMSRRLVYLSVPGKLPRFYLADSDNQGRFIFELPGYYGEGEIVVQPDPVDSLDADISILSPFYQHTIKEDDDASAWQVIQPTMLNDLKERHQELQLQRGYYADQKLTRTMLNPVDSSFFAGHPDEMFRLDEYTRFTTMEEVFREYVRTVMVRKRSDGFHLLVLNKNKDKFFDEDPFLLLDGVPIFNTQQFFSYDPLKLKKGEVIAAPHYYGMLRFSGLVSLHTYKGDLDGFPLPSYLTIRQFDGMFEPASFPAPEYDTEEKLRSRLPDFRNVLYWDPSLRLSPEGVGSIGFYTGDVPGKYVIKVEGISGDGKLLFGREFFEVK